MPARKTLRKKNGKTHRKICDIVLYIEIAVHCEPAVTAHTIGSTEPYFLFAITQRIHNPTM